MSTRSANQRRLASIRSDIKLAWDPDFLSVLPTRAHKLIRVNDHLVTRQRTVHGRIGQILQNWFDDRGNVDIIGSPDIRVGSTVLEVIGNPSTPHDTGVQSNSRHRIVAREGSPNFRFVTPSLALIISPDSILCVVETYPSYPGLKESSIGCHTDCTALGAYPSKVETSLGTKLA